MLRHVFIPLLCSLLVAPVRAEVPTVQLIAGSDPLAPNSTIEIRFSAEMVEPDQTGKPAEFPPIRLHPEVPGKFTWVSTRSGIFSPTEPYPLGTTLQIDLRDELKTRAGDKMPEHWKGLVSTPPFALQAWSALSYLPPSNAPALPSIALLFNEDVRATDVADHCWFERAGGTDRIAGTIEPPTPQRPAISYFGNG